MARALSPAQPHCPATLPGQEAGQEPGHAAVVQGVTKVYCPGSTLTALRDVDLAFPRGSCTAVMGASGCADTRAMIAALGLALAYTVIAIASTLVIATGGRRLNGPRCGWRAWRRPGRCLAGPGRFLGGYA